MITRWWTTAAGLTMNGSRSDGADAAPSATAAALAPMWEVWQVLLAKHVPDRDGRCLVCRWQTRSADRWPCNVYSLAAAAQLREGRATAIWGAFEATYREWEALGRPGWDRLGLTVTPDGRHRVWLDSPDGGPGWELPT